MPYTLHSSEKLVSIFQDKPYQGCNPATAQYLFVGLDANYAADIETSLPEVFDYLSQNKTGLRIGETDKITGRR
jgi:hypothetical protein